jgi:hypothetical protein
MDEKRDTESIKRLLNRSLVQIDPSALGRLQDARLQALNHLKARGVATLPVFARAGEHAIWQASSQRHRFYYWVGAILLAVSLSYGITYWLQAMDSEASDADIDIDIAILTDDLPLHFYLD